MLEFSRFIRLEGYGEVQRYFCVSFQRCLFWQYTRGQTRRVFHWVYISLFRRGRGERTKAAYPYGNRSINISTQLIRQIYILDLLTEILPRISLSHEAADSSMTLSLISPCVLEDQGTRSRIVQTLFMMHKTITCNKYLGAIRYEGQDVSTVGCEDWVKHLSVLLDYLISGFCQFSRNDKKRHELKTTYHGKDILSFLDWPSGHDSPLFEVGTDYRGRL